MTIIAKSTGIASVVPYAYFNTNGIIAVLAIIGGRGISQRYLRRKYVPIVPMRVAKEPNTMSRIDAPIKKFASKQPMDNPGIAVAVNAGKIQRHSENLSSPGDISVNNTKIVAMTAL